MIYVSSASVQADRIGDAVRELAEADVRYIELTGGTAFYPEWKEELLLLKKQFDLHFLLHNYFPPPRKPFILNLASIDNDIFNMSLTHYKEALKVTYELGGDRFGLHAGFYYDPVMTDLGKTLTLSQLYPKAEAIAQFNKGFLELQEMASGTVLYVENHVLSQENYSVFKPEVPLMLTRSSDYSEIQKDVSFPVLLDLAHLYVSSHSIGFDYDREVRQLLKKTDYLHISGNDGFSDSNDALEISHPILRPLLTLDLSNYIITLEVYDTIKEIKRSIEVLQSLLTSAE